MSETRRERRGFVYVLVFPNGFYYVGYTRNTLEERWAKGKAYINASNKQMRKAIEIYPWEEIQKFYLYMPDEKLGWFIEACLINALNSTEDGYNVSKGHYWKSVNKTSVSNLIKKHSEVNTLYQMVKGGKA